MGKAMGEKYQSVQVFGFSSFLQIIWLSTQFGIRRTQDKLERRKDVKTFISQLGMGRSNRCFMKIQMLGVTQMRFLTRSSEIKPVSFKWRYSITIRDLCNG